MARRMMIPTHDRRVYYWFTCRDGATTHHFDTSAGTISIVGDTVPDFERYDDHPEIFSTHTV